MVEDFYQAAQLRAENVRLAYPLISMLHPDVTLEFWQRFVRRATREPRHRAGLVAIQDRRAYVHAIFAYRVTEDVRFGLLLRITHLIMGRLPGGVLPKAIIAHAEKLAAELASPTIAIDASVDGLSSEDCHAIQQSGFRAGGVLLFRSAPPAAAVS